MLLVRLWSEVWRLPGSSQICDRLGGASGERPLLKRSGVSDGSARKVHFGVESCNEATQRRTSASLFQSSKGAIPLPANHFRFVPTTAGPGQ